MAIFPGAIATDADLYIAVNNLSTLLTDNPLTIGATTVNVLSTTGFPTVGFISIDAEIIKYTGKTATSFTGCTRGADGTTAASHALNAQVDHNVVAGHHNANKNEIIATQQFISDLIGRTNTQVRAPNGTALLPAYAFANDLDTGMHLSGVNEISFDAGGASSLRIETGFVRSFKDFIPDVANTISLGSNAQYWLSAYVGPGSAALPSYSFGGDNDTGFFQSGGDAIRAAAGGVQILKMYRTDATNLGIQMIATNATIENNLGTAARPSYTFGGDNDTGFFSASANTMNWATNGAARMSLDTVSLTLNLPAYFSFGSASAPGYAFSGEVNSGMYRAAANRLGFSAGGTEYLTIGSTGTAGAIHSGAVGGFDNTISSAGNVAIFYAIHTDDTSNASHSIFQMTTGGANGGSPYLGFSITGQNNWTMGAKNNDDDDFVIINSSNFAAGTPLFRVDRSTQSVQFAGTNTNDSAVAGFVGQYLESTSNGAANNTAANDVWFDMTSLSLTAGEWEVFLMAHGSRNTATWTRFDAGIGTTTGNSAAGLVIARNYAINEFASSATTPNNVTVMVASYRIQLTATTTYFAKARANFSAGQPQYVYTMFARRVR